ncbi:MAG TPA: hypothetical protein VJQ84_05265, partial [Solirubrobacterales bacterium]|nr:hypothetical protein [Solirubrobacterales bacterium]
KAPLARRLLAGSLDRAVDVAATLELRGYSLRQERPSVGATRLGPERAEKRFTSPSRRRSRYDRRFYATGAVVLAVAIAGKALGADAFGEYPTTEIGSGATTLAVAAVVALSGLAPLRRAPRTGRRALPFPRYTRVTGHG